MALPTLFADPFVYVVDADGAPIVGAKITTFVTGSSTPLPVFHDSDGAVPWTQPLVTNSAGQTDGPVYCSLTPSIKVVIVDADDAPVSGFPIDPWTPYALGS